MKEFFVLFSGILKKEQIVLSKVSCISDIELLVVQLVDYINFVCVFLPLFNCINLSIKLIDWLHSWIDYFPPQLHGS